MRLSLAYLLLVGCNPTRHHESAHTDAVPLPRTVAPDAARLRAAGVACEVVYAPGAGHTFQGRVARALRPVFERVVVPVLSPAADVR